MSNTVAIAAVTSTMRHVLHESLGGAQPGPVGGADGGSAVDSGMSGSGGGGTMGLSKCGGPLDPSAPTAASIVEITASAVRPSDSRPRTAAASARSACTSADRP